MAEGDGEWNPIATVTFDEKLRILSDQKLDDVNIGRVGKSNVDGVRSLHHDGI